MPADVQLVAEDFVDADFIMVRPRLVAKFGGNVAAVLMIARIQFRCQIMPVADDGHRWWKAKYDELSTETGLSAQQARRTIDGLVDKGIVIAKISNDSTWDRTRSYRVQLSDLHVSDSTDASAQTDTCISRNRQIDVSDSTDLLSIQEGFKELNTSPSPAIAVEDLFDEFWAAYPKKVNKIDARRKWEIALKKNKDLTQEELVRAAGLFAAYEKERGTERRFIKGPDVWLHKGCWADELVPERIRQSGYDGPYQNPTDDSEYDEDLATVLRRRRANANA